MCLAARSTRMRAVRACDTLNLPHFSRERSDICCVPDKLERRRAVQVVHDDSEVAVIDLHKRTGIRQRRITCLSAAPRALRECVQLVARTAFNIDEQRRAGCEFDGRGPLESELHNLAILRLMGHRTHLCACVRRSRRRLVWLVERLSATGGDNAEGACFRAKSHRVGSRL